MAAKTDPVRSTALGSRALDRAVFSADGTRLHASLFRSPAPVAGLLLVQGLQSHARWFEVSATADELSDAGITCLTCDRRGSGRSSGIRGHAESAGEFLMDLDAGAEELRQELDRFAGAGAPMHVLANCFGTRVVLPYAALRPQMFRSVILTAPATHMTRAASYPLGRKLSILLSRPFDYFPTPLRDEYFVREGPALGWIRRDPLSLRHTTAAFLRNARRLDSKMHEAMRQLRVPLLVVLSRRDVLVDNAAVRERFVARYAGPKAVVEYDADHYVDFTGARPEFRSRLETWVREEQA